MAAPFFLKPAIRTTQPSRGSVVAKTAFTKDLEFLWSGNEGVREVITNGTLTTAGTWVENNNYNGIGYRGTNNGTQRADLTPPPPTLTATNYTVFAYVNDDAGSGNNRNPIDSDNATRVFQLRFTTNNGVEFITFDTGGTPYFATSGALTWAPRNGLLVGRIVSNQLSIWWQGKQLATGSAANTARTISSGNKLTIAGSPNNNQGFLGSVMLAGVYNRALLDEEIVALSANPWQLFKAPSKKIWVPAASGNVSVTLTGSAITGNQGTIKSAISYLLSGNSSTLTTGTVVNTLSQSLSGQSITSSSGTIKSAISYTLTGSSATFSAGTLTASTGGAVSVNLTGSSTTASQGTIVAAIATALSGSSATVSRGTITATVGPTLSGSVATLSAGTITSAISRTLSGSSATFATGTLSALSGATITIKAGSWIRYRVI